MAERGPATPFPQVAQEPLGCRLLCICSIWTTNGGSARCLALLQNLYLATRRKSEHAWLPLHTRWCGMPQPLNPRQAACTLSHSLHPHTSYLRRPLAQLSFRSSFCQVVTFLLVPLLQWAAKHGPIFRAFFVRQPVVVIQDINLAHQVMIKHFNKVGCADSTVSRHQQSHARQHAQWSG